MEFPALLARRPAANSRRLQNVTCFLRLLKFVREQLLVGFVINYYVLVINKCFTSITKIVESLAVILDTTHRSSTLERSVAGDGPNNSCVGKTMIHMTLEDLTRGLIYFDSFPPACINDQDTTNCRANPKHNVVVIMRWTFIQSKGRVVTSVVVKCY